MRGKSIIRPVLVLLLGWVAVFGVQGAEADTAKPLAAKECQRLRLALEGNLPFGPGFRRLVVQFPKNTEDIEGQVCRLLTMGTGAHLEGYGIGSLKDMAAKIHGALAAAGLKTTAETARFSETSRHGREVFALYKDNSICVTTIVVGIVAGATPAADAMKAGKVMLSKLKPHQREWWISIDCFTVPPKPQVEAVIEDVQESNEDALSQFDLPGDTSGAETEKQP